MQNRKQNQAKVTTLTEFDRDKIYQVKQVRTDPLIQLKKYDGAFLGLGAGLDHNGRVSTGLTEDYTLPGPGSQAAKKVEGTRRGMERLLGLEEGTLKNTSAYWNTYQPRYDAYSKTLDLTDDLDLLEYLFLLGQSVVADGVENIDSSSKIEYVIYSEEQEAKERNEGRNALKQAYITSSNLDLETQISLLAVYGIIADSTSPSIIQDKIDEKIADNPQKFLDLLADSNLETKALLRKCLDKGILTAENGAIQHGEVPIGYDFENAANSVSKDSKLEKILRAKLSGDMDIFQEVLKETKTPAKKK